MSSDTSQVNLVSSRPADDAELFDPAFINAWGLALRPAGAGGHWWIANTDTARVTLYVGDSDTVPFGQDGLSVVAVPGDPDNDPVDVAIDPPSHDGVPLPPPTPTPLSEAPPSNPTGQVFSGSTTDFLVDGTSLTGVPLNDVPARFITVSEDGTIAAWGESGGTPAQRMNAFAVVVDNSDSGAIYKGVTVSAETGTGNLLYAANFSQGRIDVFDAHWQPVTSITFELQVPGGRDGAEFAPFNIERVFDASLDREVLIVAYAKVANAEGGEEESTDGFVAKFDIDGTFLRAGDAGGLLNAPWGVALAPADFGPYSNTLLVGNFGDGRILALDIATLEPQGYLLDEQGDPASIDGLWDIAFGNGASLGRADSLYFTAGPDEEAEGLFGSLSVDDGVDANRSFAGTPDADVFGGASGNDTINGGDGDDTLLGQLGDDVIQGGNGLDKLFSGGGNDTLSAGAGDDAVHGGAGSDVIDLGTGSDRLRDLLGDLADDRISGFGTGDALDIVDALISRSNLAVTFAAGKTTLSAGGSSFELNGNFSGGEFMTVARGSDGGEHTLLSFVEHLPTLAEATAVAPGAVNGIANEPFLAGDGSVRFTLDFKSAVSLHSNTLGVYRVAADGTIVDVEILFANTLAVPAGARTVDLGTPGDGERIGFFLVQDGFDRFGVLPDDLSFVAAAGSSSPADLDAGAAPVLHSATRGDLAGAVIFHTFATLNPGDAVQVLSGVAPGGRELQIGFEDLPTSSGDNDFQDVIVGVRASSDDPPV